MSAYFTKREETDAIERIARDMVSEIIESEDTKLGELPNWFRDFDCKGNEVCIKSDAPRGAKLAWD